MVVVSGGGWVQLKKCATGVRTQSWFQAKIWPTFFHLADADQAIMAANLIRRTKIFFPNWYLFVVRGGNQYDELGKVTFRSTTNIGKQDVKDYLNYIYGMVAKKVNVITYEGKKKRLPNGRWYTEPAYKKFVVWFQKGASPKKDPSVVLQENFEVLQTTTNTTTDNNTNSTNTTTEQSTEQTKRRNK